MKFTRKLLKPIHEYSWEGNTPESIVLHTTLGSLWGSIDWLKHIHLSYHYIISESGEIVQLVDLGRSAWHAGVRDKPDLRVRSFFGSDNPNKRSVGIAFARNGEQELTPEQVISATKLIKEIGDEVGHRYDADNIFYHQEITSYKPKEVAFYRNQVLDALIGDKDDKDAGEKTRMELYLKLLKLRLQYLLLTKDS